LDENYEQTKGIKEAGIFSIVQAKDGMIWIGHGQGVQVLDPRTNKFIRHFVDFFPIKRKDSMSRLFLKTQNLTCGFPLTRDCFHMTEKEIRSLTGGIVFHRYKKYIL
jgi:hypothetical protein